MKKQLHFTEFQSYLRSAFFLILLAGLILPMHAQRLLTEDFNYSVGNLLGQGAWVQQQGTTPNTPIEVIDASFTYPGYQEVVAGKIVKISSAGGDLLYNAFETQTSGSVYCSALVRVDELDGTGYFMSFGNGKGSTLYGAKISVKTTNGKAAFCVARANKQVIGTTEYELNQTVLLVLKYTFNAGAKNDEVKLYINPATNAPEPEANIVSDATDAGSDLEELGGIYLRSGGSFARSVNVSVGNIRVAKTWSELFDLTPQENPSLTLSANLLHFGMVFGGETYKQVLNVKGTNLAGDITITGLVTGDISLSAATITKEQAESENGFDLTVTLKPTSEDYYTELISFASEGMEAVAAKFMWSATIPVEVKDLKTLREQDKEDGWTVYRVTEGAVISHIYKDGDKTYYYVQDAERGITIMDAFGDLITPYKVGDRVTILGSLSMTFGSLSLIPSKDFGAPISQENVVTPITVTLNELATNGDTYEGRLVKVENVSFKNLPGTGEKALFEEGKNPVITDQTAEANMRLFKKTDIIGKEIPSGATLTGISTAGNGKLVAPRSYADIDPIKPSLTVSPDYTHFGMAFGGETYKQVLNVKGANLIGDITITIIGLVTGDISLSATTITKEQAESENGFDLTVTLKPTSENYYMEVISFASEGMEAVVTQFRWSATIPIEVKDLKTLREQDKENVWNVYRVTEGAVISHIYKDGNKTYYYAQDAERGITIIDEFEYFTTPYKVGDRVTILGSLSMDSGNLSLSPSKDFGAPISQENALNTVTTTLGELEANSDMYESRLIKVMGVNFEGIEYNITEPNYGAIYFKEGDNRAIFDETGEATMRLFNGTDIIGNQIPASATLIGISTSGSGKIIAPRFYADLTDQQFPTGIENTLQNQVSIWGEHSAICVTGNELLKIEITSMNGMKQAEQEAQEGVNRIEHLPAAMYIVKVITSTGSHTQKVNVK